MIGQRVGNYRVVRRLGQGGMGLVFEAVHEQIGRRAAVKVLRAPYAQDPDVVQRLHNEARAVSIASHPGLVSIFECGQLPGGAAYIVMEYLEGPSLGQRLRQGALPLSEVLRLFRQIASAVHAAHQHGVVHRDLKPDNVMIILDPDVPGGERVKVLDFGVAKLKESIGPPASQTRIGMVLGTPIYMAPEQCRGLLVDEKADVYSLGAMLYEALCCRPPFIGAGAFETMALHVYEPVTPPSTFDPQLPQAVESLVLQMLQKRAADRPSMDEVAEALGLLAGSAHTSRPGGRVVASLLHSGYRRRGRRVSMLTSGALGLLALVALGAGRPHGLLTSATPPARPSEVQGPRRPSEERLRSRVSYWVTTKPAGAQVVRADSGQVLGTTPWRHEQAGGQGSFGVVLRLQGFYDKRLDLDLADDVIRQETLEPVLLYSVFATAPAQIWAAGNEGTVLHFDGRAWTPVPTGTRRWLYGLWSGGPADVWAVGSSGTVLHWDGSRFGAFNSGTDSWLYGVWGFSPGGDAAQDDVWAVGGGGAVLHWEGHTFSVVPSGTHRRLYGVWGSGPRDVWAAGDGGTLLHWDGQSLLSQDSGTTGWLYGVWGSGPRDVWAVGHAGTILHYDGAAWSAVASGTDRDLYGVWGHGQRDVWAVGDKGAVLHWDGEAWEGVPAPGGHQGQKDQPLYSVRGLPDAPGAGVWAVGYSGTILGGPALLALTAPQRPRRGAAGRATPRPPGPSTIENEKEPRPGPAAQPPIHQEFTDEDVRIVE